MVVNDHNLIRTPSIIQPGVKRVRMYFKPWWENVIEMKEVMHMRK